MAAVSDQAKPMERKPYTPPQLVVYGDIAQITQNVTNMGTKIDNPTMKT
jgi:hypothetical protein